MAGNVKVSLVLTQPQHEYFKAESERLGISIAELMRRLWGEARPGLNDPVRAINARLPARVAG